MQIATIIKGPCLLGVGANGKKYAGLIVRSLRSREECAKKGLSYEWGINHHSLSHGYDPELIGIGPIQMYRILHECERLENAKIES